jgi:hypothetical protein
MIDIDNTNLRMLPFDHDFVGQSDEIIRISNQNKSLKIGLIISLVLVFTVIIIVKKEEEETFH